jgi:hypothetical protein
MKIRLMLALFAATVPAIAANPPVQFSDTQSLSTSFACPDGGIITETATFNETGTAFFDANGFTTHVILHDFITQTFVGPTGITLSGTNRQNETFDVNTGALSVRGLQNYLRLPDSNYLLISAGRVTVDSSGNVTFTPHLATATLATICAAVE